LRLYASSGAAVRGHTRIRAWTAPLADLAARTPETGRLLEVGCGHGLFANACAVGHPGLEVLGIDPAPAKIAAAEASVGARGNVRFRCQRLEELPERGFDAVAVVDVLYLVPRREWTAFLGRCRDVLRPGGRLLLKDVETRPRWKFYRCVAQETLSVKLLGITLGSGFAFAGREEMVALLSELGFGDVRAVDLGRGYLTPHVLYEAARA